MPQPTGILSTHQIRSLRFELSDTGRLELKNSIPPPGERTVQSPFSYSVKEIISGLVQTSFSFFEK